MKPHFLIWVLGGIAGVVVGTGTGVGLGGGIASAQSPAPLLEGRWSGTLGPPTDPLRVVVEIHAAAGGSLQGSISGLVPGSRAIAIDAIEQRGSAVRLVVGEISGGFEGTLSSDGARLTGLWSELAVATPLELVRSPTSQSQPRLPTHFK